MYKLIPVLVLTAVAGVSIPVPVVAAERLMAPFILCRRYRRSPGRDRARPRHGRRCCDR
jgi:hypothetical protein